MRKDRSPGEPSSRVLRAAACTKEGFRAAQGDVGSVAQGGSAATWGAASQGEDTRGAAVSQGVPPSPDADARSARVGLLEGVGCHVVWGLMPVYWKLLSAVPALEVLSWRMVWSCVFVVLLCAFVKRTRFLHLFRDPRAVRTFLASGLIVTCNWGVYVWAANSGHLLETSIGYYLCPLCNITLGLVVFKERLTFMQKLATALAAAGVAYFMVVHGGDIWIAFALALSFSAYGAVKKRGGYPALPGMAFESLLTGVLGALALAVGAVAPWIWQLAPATPDALAVTSPELAFGLLVGCGLLTAIPLLLYSAAANRISMTALGFIQYVSPTIALVLAVGLFGEAFTLAHAVCFACIWTGIAAVGAEGALSARKRRAGV
ncbi:EamA family transporter RarD [Gordonibacter sp. An230]|uniref:EamA family transporter RarD n=1 Tax=Gordonibacter sp. An230 TaxID=1965592 RepID=UPI0013A6448D|nr:EamA family transporter RarD [Gordonibacter sp. An230]